MKVRRSVAEIQTDEALNSNCRFYVSNTNALFTQQVKPA